MGLVATGGSGALASVIGVARAMEEGGVRPAVLSMCSGSALFGFPIGAGVPADEAAAFTIGLDPDDYLDIDWSRLARLVPTLGRGFAGILRGDAIEAAYRRLLGDMTLAEMPIPTYAPIWNIEENRVEYLGPRTHPHLAVARAVHMAVALPLFIAPVALDGQNWCDGGIVDIFPVHPVLDIEEPCDAVLAVNGFYPPGFVGEDATGWEARRGSILYVASQVRTCQQVELARENLARLRAASEVTMLEPVPYEKVQGIGFYRQFLDTRDWPDFMRRGRLDARRALAGRCRCAPLVSGSGLIGRPRRGMRRRERLLLGCPDGRLLVHRLGTHLDHVLGELVRGAHQVLDHLERRVDDLAPRALVVRQVRERTVDGVDELPYRLECGLLGFLYRLENPGGGEFLFGLGHDVPLFAVRGRTTAASDFHGVRAAIPATGSSVRCSTRNPQDGHVVVPTRSHPRAPRRRPAPSWVWTRTDAAPDV